MRSVTRRACLAGLAGTLRAQPRPLAITGFRTRKYTLSGRDFLFLLVETDGGITGVGEGSLPGRAAIVEEAIRWLEPHYLGQDPGAIDDLWNRAYYQLSRWRDGSVLMTALSAVDLALWDIEGRRFGVPVSRLLGAGPGKNLRVYYSHWSQELKQRTPAALAELARQTKASGWTAVKWIAFRGGSESERLRRIVAEVQAVREAAGPDFEIALELAETFTVRTALELARALAPFRVMFIEEPTWRESPQALGQLAAASPVPIAAGEGLLTRYDFRHLLDAKGAQVLQPDVIHCGGITELRRIAAFADTHGAEIAPHMWYGPIAHAASLHAMAACRNFLIQEWDAVHDSVFSELTRGTYPVPSGGRVTVPTRPGLGIEMDFDAWEKRFPWQGPSRRPPTGRP